MRKRYLACLIFSFLLFGACNKVKNNVVASNLNPTLRKIIAAHVGIKNWKKEKTLTFKTAGQTQIIDLQSRDIKIKTSNFSMGSKNGVVWIKQDSAVFPGSPRFYHSLMFYFHTMPFVFADPGINYETVPDKTIEGTTFSGLKMSFDANTGDVPNDQYILYYHPDTYKWSGLLIQAPTKAKKRAIILT